MRLFVLATNQKTGSSNLSGRTIFLLPFESLSDGFFLLFPGQRRVAHLLMRG